MTTRTKRINSLWNGDTLNTDKVPSKSGEETMGIVKSRRIRIICCPIFFTQYNELRYNYFSKFKCNKMMYKNTPGMKIKISGVFL